MTWLHRVAPLGVLLLASCTAPPRSDAGADAPPPGVAPPGPPAPRALPPELADLPRSEDGLPVLATTGAPGPDVYEAQLVYDEAADDPITRWGQCLSRVVACYDANPSGPIAGCLERIERCERDSGGEGCCPAPCLRAVADAIAGGAPEDDAIDATLVRGDCVEGFAAVRAALEAP